MGRIDSRIGFLTRLARDVRGNTLAIMAAALIPLAGLIGGGVDMSRLYLVKTRLQQACDAGALAGRKAMGPGSWTTGSDNGSTNDKAEKMFVANISTGQYGTSGLTKNFSESNGIVSGTAGTTVPMTIMKIFGMTSRTLSVTCEAKMEIPNTDVMFVLDVTGSMATNDKIGGLKRAVKCFYEALQRVNTTEVCGNDPTATTSTTTAQIRLGFVPYSVNVNVGKLLPNSFLADSWTYQSRSYGWDGVTYDTSNSTSNWTYASGSVVTDSKYQISGSSCPWDSTTSSDVTGPTTTTTAADGTITSTYTVTRTTNGAEYELSSSGSGSKKKYYCQKTTYTNYAEKQVNSTVKTPHYAYTYAPRTFNVSALKAGGSNWNNSVTLDVGTAGANVAVTWPGCIEERFTFQNTDGDPSNDWSPIPSDALDMNIDLTPSMLTPHNSYWGPLLPGAEWARYSWGYSNCYSSGRTTGTITTSCNAGNASASCPAPARKLTTYNTAGPLETYINTLTPTGNTYHDIGMIWGARLLSPTGIFASENAFGPSGGPIQRHLIFMTDGDTNTSGTDYSAYGIGYYDRRQAQSNFSDTQMDDMTNARLLALCNAVKNMNVTLWVVSYGTDVSSDTQDRLKQCSTGYNTTTHTDDGVHFVSAANTAALTAQFQNIAAKISQLRLTH